MNFFLLKLNFEFYDLDDAADVCDLTHWDWNKMADIMQMTFSSSKSSVFENVICKMLAISVRHQWVKSSLTEVKWKIEMLALFVCF